MMTAAAAMAFAACQSSAPAEYTDEYPLLPEAEGQEYVSQRPAPQDRCFTAPSVERTISEVQAKLTNPKLAWMFGNCFPNTLDTTVQFTDNGDGTYDTFVITGDIHAMWLRDSGAQVWPYMRFAAEDEHVRHMLAGVIARQIKCINIDPYANAFNFGPTGGHWQSDLTKMDLNVHERKWEIDSQCYPIRLAYAYWKTTGDTSVFTPEWVEAMHKVYETLTVQQRKKGSGKYRFMRVTQNPLDSKSHYGKGGPVNPVGLIVSSFRPSDDATTLEFLIPSNFMAVTSLRKGAEILETVNSETELAASFRALADEVETALGKYAVVKHPKYGKIYAYEVDGFGGQILMDDANVPSLLSLPYLGDVPVNDRIYRNTRRFLLSPDNPYFAKGEAAEGISGPHVGRSMIWPMTIMMRAFTSTDDAEISMCMRMLMNSDAGTGFMHESFDKDDPTHFTRAWFAWQNSLFGELVLHLIDEGKLELLNSITVE